jgi:hypothetical protein
MKNNRLVRKTKLTEEGKNLLDKTTKKLKNYFSGLKIL